MFLCLSDVSVEEIPETDEEKIARLEQILLQDLRLLKHRQVIHPVLQEGTPRNIQITLNNIILIFKRAFTVETGTCTFFMPLSSPNLREKCFTLHSSYLTARY